MEKNQRNLIDILNKIKIRKNNEERTNIFLKNFFSIVYDEDKLLFENLDIAFNLIVFLLKSFEEYINNYDKNMDINKISKFNFNEKISLINDFYQKLGINFNINEIINNGIFNPYIIGSDHEETPTPSTASYGWCGFIDNKPSIEINDNNIITDAAIWIHEISHYRDLPKQKIFNPVRDILTESLAFTEEIIFLDYIDNLGYSYESAITKLNEFKMFYQILKNSYLTIKPYLIFDKLGEISRENYLLYFGYDDDYDIVLDNFTSNILDAQKYNIIYTYLQYCLAAALSIYMYIEYEKKPDFIHNILDLKEKLNSYSFKECLTAINLSIFDENFYSKIKNSIKEFSFEIENGSDKIIASTALTNDYFGELVTLYYKDKNMAFDKVNEIFSLISFLKNHICRYIEDNIPVFEYEKFSKANIEEKIELINAFYKYLGTSFRLNQEILSNNFNIEDACTEKYLNDKDTSTLINKIGSGTSYFDEQIQVDVYDSGLLYDSITWIHELKHFQNQPLGDRSQISFVLTEGLSFTEELIYTDFLEKLGYNYEAYISKYDTFSNFSVFLEDAYPMIKMLSVYVNYGEISKQNYEKAYPNDEYENDIDEVLTLLTEDAEDFFNLIRYSVASALSIYMYEEYKKDNNFIVKINEFEKAINTANSINECLNIIGLSGLNKESLNKIESSLNTFKKELNNIIQSNTINLFNIEKNKVI